MYVIMYVLGGSSMTTVNITNARQELFKLAQSCIKFNDIITVSTKDGNIIMLSEQEYKNILESLYLASIPGMYESIKEGVETPLSECVEIQWKK